MRRGFEVLGLTLVVLGVLSGVVVVITVATPATEDDVRQWFDAVGGVISAAAAVVVALIGFRAQKQQARESAAEQRQQARESLEASRLVAAEAAQEARQLEVERFENQRRLEQERQDSTLEFSKAFSLGNERRNHYGDLIAWAHRQLTRRDDVYDSGSEYGRALAIASDAVRRALEDFERSDESGRQLAYERLVATIRRELGSDELSGPLPSS
ncbi:hypothetical protein [Kribbella sp. NPDC004536]|uniref:hypothetical protein n=1 Tax=Kribbella sp. NPDC004536 TaxID=3364106 RepID=UPI00367C7781